MGRIFLLFVGLAVGVVPVNRAEPATVEGLIERFDNALISGDFGAATALIADSALIRLADCDSESQMDREQYVELLSSKVLSSNAYLRSRRNHRVDSLGEDLGGVSHSVLYESRVSDGEPKESSSDQVIYVTVVDGRLEMTSLHSSERCR